MRSKRAPSILVLTLALVATACPREQDEPLTDDTGDETTPSGSEGTSGVATTTATTTDDPSADSTGTGGEECQGPDGCHDCPPTTPTEVLDACTDATCSAFPNTVERLPLLERDGSLPPIP